MNIFVTSLSPYLCAIALDNKRLIKMILETAQLLSTAIHQHAPEQAKNLYKPTHAKHPCTIWTQQSQSNYSWLLTHFQELLKEYSHRYNKNHKSGELLESLQHLITYIPKGKLTTFANCTNGNGANFKNIPYTVLAYRKYMIHKWKTDKTPPAWKKRMRPNWYIAELFKF